MKISRDIKIRLTGVISIAALILLCVSCREKELKPANVEIIDPDRHYYPVIQGELMPVTYEIENLSKEPLVINEIQTTCGCIIPKDELPIIVLPKKSGKINLLYNTTKNTGAVEHYVWLYGNFTGKNYRELKFDTNVVPPADYTRDYEQLYHEFHTHTGTMKDLVDGYSYEKGYYTDDGSPRAKTREERQRKADELAF